MRAEEESDWRAIDVTSHWENDIEGMWNTRAGKCSRLDDGGREAFETYAASPTQAALMDNCSAVPCLEEERIEEGNVRRNDGARGIGEIYQRL